MQYEILFRDLASPVLAAVVRRFHDFAASEDAVQEALLAATIQWPEQGIPENPRAWLIHVATCRMTDYVRAESARRRRESEAARLTPVATRPAAPEHDDELALFFMCCHPALTTSSAIALTLRAVGGLTTAEIASAFLTPEASMAQRISRAKQVIKESRIPLQLPGTEERAQRMRAVLHVLYLIFNEAYISSGGQQVQRLELSQEAIRLTRSLHAVAPGDAEAAGLLALMLLTNARRNARTGPNGELIPLMKQDRSLWDQAQIAEGVTLLTAAIAKGAIGPYQLQAAIAAVHDEATRAEDTDWPQILALYELLKRSSDNPVVRLNHAVAAAMVHGPAKGLALLDALADDPRICRTHRLYAVRAHLLEMAGDTAQAIANYSAAAARSTSVPERNYLLTQAARLGDAQHQQHADRCPSPPLDAV